MSFIGRIPRRVKPRTKKDLGLHKPPKPESWQSISLRVRKKWWADGKQVSCGICGGRIYLWSDLVPDHIKPGKMGGCKDNSDGNLQPAHSLCNVIKGSKRNFKIRSRNW